MYGFKGLVEVSRTQILYLLPGEIARFTLQETLALCPGNAIVDPLGFIPVTIIETLSDFLGPLGPGPCLTPPQFSCVLKCFHVWIPIVLWILHDA